MDSQTIGKKDDQGKLRYDLVPVSAFESVAQCMTFGANKYGDNNWQGVSADRYYAAAMRHLLSWKKGEINDPESGFNHLKHVLTNIVFLLEKTENKSEVNRVISFQDEYQTIHEICKNFIDEEMFSEFSNWIDWFIKEPDNIKYAKAILTTTKGFKSHPELKDSREKLLRVYLYSKLL